MVLQWKNHEVTKFLMKELNNNRDDLKSSASHGLITADTINQKNYDLGKLELLNYLLDEDFYQGIVEDLEGEEDE